ncbi:hypothetical protein I5Q34_26790 [Streptomyces sp. AV19]|nr:hypothetical protein [Streptomyces sp. AV19]MBH1937834.1 hypothetical protein [Streptomyces sp. AV19]MDG4537112.1 hypothetical protein [Streptomyces sp. AV19]
MRTLRELRAALRTHGRLGDLQQFEEELDAADLDDLTAVRRITQHYRHRVLLRLDPVGSAAVGRPTDDVMAELRRKLADGAAR